MPVILGSAVTVNPLNGADVPPVVVTVTVRVPGDAPDAIAIATGKLVAVPPLPIVAVTPDPLNVTAVAPPRLVPEIVAATVVPEAPLDGLIPVIAGTPATIANGADCTASPASATLPALLTHTPMR
jgi:hypothetical protein